METQLTTTPALSVFANSETFELAQRQATMLASTNLVPAEYRGKDNLGNCVIALEMAQRMNASPLAVMQNLYIVHGKPSWSASFIIAALNSTGKFSSLRFELTGEGDARSCIAWANETETGERLEGPAVTIAMAKAEGWFQKNGSKWQTMPDVMLRYRTATLFGRLYAPEILMGMQTADEVHDVGERPVEGREVPASEQSVIDPFEKVEAPEEVAEEKPEPKGELPV